MSTVNRKWQCAGVAQLVEQRIRNAQVVGSSPTTSFIPKPLKTRCFQGFLFIYAYIPLWLSVKRHHNGHDKPCKIKTEYHMLVWLSR